MRNKNGKRALVGVLIQMLAAGTWLAASQLPASAATWATGDIFAAVSNGQYLQYQPPPPAGGVLKDTLQVNSPEYVLTGTGVTTTGFKGYTGQCAIRPAGDAPLPIRSEDLYTTLWNENQIAIVDSGTDPHPVKARIDTAHPFANQALTLTGHPQSIVFDSVGDFYVGLVDGAAGEANLLKYDRDATTGTLAKATYQVPSGTGRGVAAMSLTANNDVIYYTTQDSVIRTFNVVNNAPGPDFVTNQTLQTLYGIRLLQGGSPFGGTGAGFLMVADYSFNPAIALPANPDTGVIRVFNSAGTQVNTYGGAGTGSDRGWFSLSVKSGGAEFVAGDFRTGNMVTFGAAGKISTATVNVTNQPFRLNGSCVKGEQTPGVVPFPSSGFFVIGDKAAGYPGGPGSGPIVLNKVVNFWGNDWAANNAMSGVNGSNQGSFKGFAETTSPPVPNCAQTGPPSVPAATFESGGGNSVAPPATLPTRVAVIVVSSLTKDGTIKAIGTVRAILLVQVTPGGYNGSPGGSGSGTVVQVICGS